MFLVHFLVADGSAAISARLLRNGDEHTFPNTEYQANFRTGWLIVYQLVGEEREEIAQFDLEDDSGGVPRWVMAVGC